MRFFRLILLPVLLASMAVHVYAAPFSLFPKAWPLGFAGRTLRGARCGSARSWERVLRYLSFA